MGEIQTVYHDRLQMSSCGRCTLMWKWFGQWKREEKYNKDKKGKLESFVVCLSCSPSFSVHQWSVIDVIEIDFQVNYCVCPSVSGDNNSTYLCDSGCPLLSVFRKKVRSNCPFQYSGPFPWLFRLEPSCSALSTTCLLGQLISWSIRWRVMWRKSKAWVTRGKERF